jgi:hypothetical protein
MRIVDKKTFLALPENTLYSDYVPCAFDDLQIRGKAWDSDFFCIPLAYSVDAFDTGELFDKLEDSRKNGTSVKMDLETYQRDGRLDDDQLYAVWEKSDIEQLIERLKKCL